MSKAVTKVRISRFTGYIKIDDKDRYSKTWRRSFKLCRWFLIAKIENRLFVAGCLKHQMSTSTVEARLHLLQIEKMVNHPLDYLDYALTIDPNTKSCGIPPSVPPRPVENPTDPETLALVKKRKQFFDECARQRELKKQKLNK